MFPNILKAAVSVVLTPVAVVVDVVRLPVTAEKTTGRAFECTEFLIDSAAKNVKKIVED